MDQLNRAARPTSPRVERAEAAPQVTRQHAQLSGAKQQKKPSRKQFIVVIGLLVALAVAWGALSWFRIVGPLAGVKSDRYQAVFLTNDQVYFGKVIAMTDGTITLRDVYYLKQKGDADAAKTDQTADQQVQLAKLGASGEVHNPDNEMRINRTQVLFWENMKDDSQVVKTIKQAN